MNMQVSFFKMAEQIEEYGFYGEVEIEFEVTANYDELTLLLDKSLERWRPGILFGASYFLEHSIRRLGLIVRIKNLLFHEVDTSNTIIAYIIYHALLKETEFKQTRSVVFDKEMKSFIFPK